MPEDDAALANLLLSAARGADEIEHFPELFGPRR